MKIFSKLVFSAVMAATVCTSAKAYVGWPENYQGVMLQAFYWESFEDTKWTNLTAQADELSRYFDLIWIPNSAQSSGGMGYMPMYWFTHHTSAFGVESEFRNMMKTFNAKGTNMIADVVINHRVGVSDWYDFPQESWNGKHWKIGLDGICSDDELALQADKPKPTGAKDSGEHFNGARDLDHSNANVQNNVKNYQKCLMEKYGYAGFRLDMVKGYSGEYTKIYNEYSQPKFSVGEYLDGSYDRVKAWIESTGRTSAAFDFPCKYQINKAFSQNDMRQLVWQAPGSVPQPAGMIHYEYQQFAVTFVDNHDSYRETNNKFKGDVPAANAFILCSPGTPCIFLPHWKEYKEEIKTLINLRNAVGVHNMSKVNVLKTAKDCYMAEVTGANGKLVVRIGSATDEPEGYSEDDVRASGTLYKVWSKVDPAGIGDIVTDDDVEAPAVYYNLSGARVDNPSTGFYIVVRGSRVTKEYVR